MYWYSKRKVSINYYHFEFKEFFFPSGAVLVKDEDAWNGNEIHVEEKPGCRIIIHFAREFGKTGVSFVLGKYYSNCWLCQVDLLAYVFPVLSFFSGKIDEQEWRFLLTGGVALENKFPNPASDWLTDKSWAEMVRCSALPSFQGILNHFTEHVSLENLCVVVFKLNSVSFSGLWF